MKELRRHAKKIALLLVSVQLLEMLLPLHALALTGGPSVPEVQQFSQAGEQQLVNLFTGDFNYNIPLLDVGGYPVSISYSSSGVNMEADATCVGLGWNLDIGSISRDTRGLPDDFNGDVVVKEMNIKPKTEVGVSMGFASEFVGFDFAKFGNTFSTTMSRNNYDGWEIGLGMSQTQKFSADCGDVDVGGSLDFGVGISNKGGASFNANSSLSAKMKEGEHSVGVGTGIGLGVTSREGLKSLSFNAGFNGSRKHNVEGMQYTSERTREGGQSVNFKFPVSFSSTSYNPSYDMPLKTLAGEFSFKLGGEVTLMHLSGSVAGSVSRQELVANKDSMPAYGYIYSQNSSSGRNLLDFNRENDGAFIAERPNLPVASFTHDVYTINGQGVGGSFRPFRNDIGTLHDPLKTQDNNAINGGFEVGLGQLVKFGGDFKVTTMRGQTKKWEEGNTFAAPFAFKGENELYESVYFKNMGEATAMANPEQFAVMGGYHPICAEVNNNGTTTGKIISPALKVAEALPINVLRTNRESRNTLFSYLSAREASANAIEKQISSYKQGIPPMQADAASTSTSALGVKRINRASQHRAGHHLSEITVTRNDGVRYVYGLPAYNLYTRDVSFNISRTDATPDGKKMIEYVPGVDNTIRNRRGLDNFFESEKIPAHPYAWMLTGVLSDDYIDITGNGPSSDDLGNYTRINYTQTNASYMWRMPMQKNKAFFQEGTKSDAYDNKAHYSYGEKEIWNVHSIETKNYEAEFYYSERNDGLAALDQNGGNDNRSRLSKLDSIVLYSKSERLEKGNNAVPLKKVFLEYDYTLCAGVPNGITETTGKLTLTKISFTYGTSLKGKLSPYKFTYSTTNPNYNPKKIDKWGNYIDKSAEEDDASNYAKLSKTTADTYASAWLLTGIKTPEGSAMQITYETDDYAYVQDRVAMEMFPIKALTLDGDKDAIPTEADLLGRKLYDGDSKYHYLKFELKKPTSNREELRAYINGIEELFFSAQIDLAARSYPTGGDVHAIEKVDGFVPVSLSTYNIDYGFCTGGGSGEYRYAWIKLPLLVEGDGNAADPGPNGVQPFAKAAWQKIRKNMPELIYNDPSPMDAEIDPLQFAEAAVNTMAAMGEFFSAPNKLLRDHGHAEKIDLSKSKIRLNTPQFTKYGGGSRVKEITVNDGWDVMTGLPNTSSNYGTEYLYSTTANIGGQHVQVSSGVASYEPSTNADENPFSVPTRYSVEKPLSIDLSLYQVGPVGQIFYPGAVIGYSKVKVRNRQYSNVTKNATGFTTHEFYTAKDFPTITSQTSMQVNPKEVPFPPFYYEKQVTVSQGVCVQLNNMHGKEKAVNVFQETDSVNPISGQQFFYKSFGNRLRDSTFVVDPNTGIVTRENFGVDYEVYTDARESVEETFGPGVEVNTDGFMASVIPVFIPGIYPQMNYVLKRYRAITFTKLIHQSGILDRVESYSNGANVSASTTVYDKQTGAPIVNETVNEFGGKQYGINIPAYWVTNNKGMDAAYKNQGAKMMLTFPITRNYSSLLNVGDEILIHQFSPVVSVFGIPGLTTDAPPKKAWVLEVTPDKLSLIDEAGVRVWRDGSYWIEVLRSGKRNHLAESAGTLQTLANPVNAGRLILPDSRIIDATASTYGNVWQTYAAFTATQPQYQCDCKAYSDKLGKSYKTVLENFVRTIFSKGDYNETGVDLSSSDYSEFSTYLNSNLSRGTRKMNALRCGTQMEWQIINSDSTSCNIVLSMADGRTSFPDSILSFNLDLSLSDTTDRANCDNSNTALGTITYRGGLNLNTAALVPSTATARVRITSSCLPILLCEEKYVGQGELNCSATGSGKVNPFVCGILGNWRKKADYAYRSERSTGNNATGGTFSGVYNSFFTNYYPLRNSDSISNWQLATTATVYDPYGRNLESKNSLGIYSSEVFGYGFSMPVLAAANSRYLNTAFDGFEDYQYKNAASNPWNDCPVLPHFKFDTASAKINSEFSHTGNSSLQVNTSVVLTRSYYPFEEATTAPVTEGTFTANRNNLIQPFTPNPGKYIFSAWIRKESSTGAFGSSSGANGGTNVLQNIGNLLQSNIPLLSGGLLGTSTLIGGEVKIKCTSNTGAETTLTTSNSEGKSIDGWKQINATFEIPANVRSITVELSTGSRAWYDDLRIQPFSSMMKTFVYDPRTLRIMATLDENNYAAMYEYDNQGNLVRTKKETEDNIVTLQEIRSSKPKTR